jgi:hypothetical protein
MLVPCLAALAQTPILGAFRIWRTQCDVARFLDLPREDPDTDIEDRAVDSRRYLVMSRTREQQAEIDNARSPWLVANAFKLNELRD